MASIVIRWTRFTASLIFCRYSSGITLESLTKPLSESSFDIPLVECYRVWWLDKRVPKYFRMQGDGDKSDRENAQTCTTIVCIVIHAKLCSTTIRNVIM